LSDTGRPASPAPSVEASGWGWRHAGRRAWALRGLDLRIEAGERVLLLGASGAGKSTLLLALAGLLDGGSGRSEGSLTLDGRSPATLRDRIGIVFQDPATQLVMGRAGDDVAFGLENRGVPTERIWPLVDEALERVGFGYARDRPTAALSGGEQQRLALAGAMALRPGLLLLDEPTANLDPEGAALVRESLERILREARPTLLLVEHHVAEVLPLIDRVIVLEAGGGVLVEGPPDHLFARYGDRLAAAGIWVPGYPLPAPVSRPRPAAATVLTTDQLRFRHPGAAHDALRRTDLQVRSAEALAVTGPTGSGKTTLALLLGGLLRPTGGSVVAGEALAAGHAGDPIWRWRARELVLHIGSVFQQPGHQFLTRRVRDELRLGPLQAGLGAAQADRRADELLARLHLEPLAAANPFTLSGGEQRRLSVATALATAPSLVILDEPTFGQDRRTAAELLALLAATRDAGHGLVVVTHDREFAAALADRTLRLAAPAPDEVA